MRELTTIGSLRTMRAIERSSRLLPMRGMGWMGATSADFLPPTLQQVDAAPPGAALSSATVAMLDHFASDGVPSVHATKADPFVLSFQQAYNADPAPWVKAGAALETAGVYGPNTHDAAAALVDYTGGGTPPAVNGGASPIQPTPPSPSPGHAILWILAIAAALGAAYAAHRLLKKRRPRARRAALPSRAIVLT